MDEETRRKAEAFDEILAIYFDQEVDDFGSEWEQGSFYDEIVARYLGIPTVWNGLDND